MLARAPTTNVRNIHGIAATTRIATLGSIQPVNQNRERNKGGVEKDLLTVCSQQPPVIILINEQVNYAVVR